MELEVNCTPKYHPEIEGEGIEKAHCKNRFCSILLDRKKGKNDVLVKA
jgi:hypothetical protein